jgi:Domain of unknown function (DUF3883)
MATGESWSDVEIEAVISDYVHMLLLQESGQRYNKSEHRRRLLTKLTGRSGGSVELKHQNISAILLELGYPWINGYKPRSNYQKALRERLVTRLETDKKIDEVVGSAVEQPAVAPLFSSYQKFLVAAPVMERVADSTSEYRVKDRRGIRKDYLAAEANNRSLGAAGEEFILSYERHRLIQFGKTKLSEKVERVSATKGDGLGFDILSFDIDGAEKYIEVKTTAFGKESPFYVTRSELSFSKDEPDKFNLYRLFEFRNKPKMFSMVGPISECCLLDPVSYLARFR